MNRDYMNRYLAKYAIGMTAIIFTFGNFIACGTQLYRVSVEEDLDSSILEKANPEVNNPKSTLYGIHATQGWQTIPIPFRFGSDMTDSQKLHFLTAIKKWEWAVGKKLFAYQGTHEAITGDSFEDLYSSLSDNINGQYLDNDWKKTSKPDHVLATTIWNNDQSYSIITKADIRFNHQNYIIGDSLELRATEDREVVDMQSLALHELGHLLGLAHVSEDVDDFSIMNPSLFIGEGLTTRILSKGDISRIQQVYGCHGNACDIDQLMVQSESGKISKSLVQVAQLWMESGSELSPDESSSAFAH